MMPLLIAHEHRLLAEGIAAYLRHAGYGAFRFCASGDEVMTAVDDMRPGAMIVDLQLPRRGGLEILRRVKALRLAARVVLLCAGLSGAQALEAVRLGVDGLVLKEGRAEDLLECLATVGAGERWLSANAMRLALNEAAGDAGARAVARSLSPREAEIVRAAGGGSPSKAIANALGITEGTVKLHLHRIYRKLGVANRTELALAARDRGLG